MPHLEFKKTSLALYIGLLSIVSYAADPQVQPQPRPEFEADAIIRQQQRDQALEKQLQPIPELQTGLEKQLQTQPQLQFLKSNSEDICFDIKKFILMGDDARTFTFALRSITQGENNIIGRCIGVQGLNQALDLVQNSIIRHGYVTTRMLLPQQNIASGEIKLQVIAGKVD